MGRRTDSRATLPSAMRGRVRSRPTNAATVTRTVCHTVSITAMLAAETDTVPLVWSLPCAVPPPRPSSYLNEFRIPGATLESLYNDVHCTIQVDC